MIICLDLETTGLEPTDEVVEIGCCDIADGKTIECRRYFVRPARPIPAIASSIHHITNADVKDALPWADAWKNIAREPLADEKLVLVAHMAKFERQWIDTVLTTAWVCTWKCALRLWPLLESHSLQALRYQLALPVKPDLAMPPHRALPDAYVCSILLLDMLKIVPLDTLIAWSAEPAVFTKFDFGEHTGKPLSEVRIGYFEWMLTKDFSEDWRWNAQREIARRAGAAVEAAAAARRSYLDLSLVALAGAASVRDLENWYTGQADHFAQHSILVGTDDYVRLIAACSDRKRQLLESGQPQFGGAPA